MTRIMRVHADLCARILLFSYELVINTFFQDGDATNFTALTQYNLMNSAYQVTDDINNDHFLERTVL